MDYGDAAKPQAKDAPMAPATQGSAKRAKHKKSEEDELRRMKELMTLMAKLTLANALHARTLRAIVIQCIKIKADSKWAVAHKAGTVEYEQLQKRHKADGKVMDEIKELIGIPSVMGFNKMVGVYAQLEDNHLANLEAFKDKDQASFQKFEAQKYYVTKLHKSIAKWPTMEGEGVTSYKGWKLIHRQLPHSRVAKMYNAQDKRLEMAAPTEANWDMSDWLEAGGDKEVMILWPIHVWIMIKKAILGAGGKEMLGMAPAGDLERKIQEYLDGEKEDQD